MTAWPELVFAYLCGDCGIWHYKGDAEYEPHLTRQAPPGVQRVLLPEAERIYRAVVRGAR